MTLYEIDNKIKDFIDRMFDAVDENGEIIGVNPDDLDALNEAREQKLENIALYIKNIEADADAIKKEENTLKERRIVLENKAENLKRLLAGSMIAHDESKFTTARCAVSFRKSDAVVITDADLVPPEFKTEVVDVKIDKTKIKKMIKDGVDIDGAYIEERQNIQIK